MEVENRGVEGEDGEEDLEGFTKSEVTVIDTSCPVWKVDKFVFRKNSVWKIRERKQKNKFVAKKKSKSTHELDIHGIGSSKDNAVNIGREACKETEGDLMPHPKKRQVHLLRASCGN